MKQVLIAGICIIQLCVFAQAAEPVYWGSWVTSYPSDVAVFESLVGKKMSLAHYGSPWVRGKTTAGADNYVYFSTTDLQREWNAGRLLIWDWFSYDNNDRLGEPRVEDFSYPAILSGKHDAFLHAWAAGAAYHSRV